jgi:glutamate---cysteine ligase / carboxylate-amine ligase
VALVQALAKRAGARVAAGKGRTFPPAWRIRENKWRASRHGMEAEYIISDDGGTMPVRKYLLELLDELEADGFAEAGMPYLTDIRRIGEGAPTSADRQRALFERTGSSTR